MYLVQPINFYFVQKHESSELQTWNSDRTSLQRMPMLPLTSY